MAPTVEQSTGFALSLSYVDTNATCPLGAPTTCSTLFQGNSCCPEPQQCFTDDLGSVYCCPSGTACEATLWSTPVCAELDWVMYGVGTPYPWGYFCCESGQRGVVMWSALGRCLGSNETLHIGSVLATVIPQGPTSTLSSYPSATNTAPPPNYSIPVGPIAASFSIGAKIGCTIGIFFAVALVYVYYVWQVQWTRKRVQEQECRNTGVGAGAGATVVEMSTDRLPLYSEAAAVGETVIAEGTPRRSTDSRTVATGADAARNGELPPTYQEGLGPGRA